MAWTHKQRMLAALKGEPTDRLPWAPRLDLWHKAHKHAGTLPARFRGASLAEITDGLDCGFHAVIPDFKDLRDPADEMHRALGIYNLWTVPYATVLENVASTVSRDGDEMTVEYETPVGSIRTKVLYDERMRAAGITISHISEHAIKSAADYQTVGYIFENARVRPNAAGYQEFADQVGDRGLAVGYASAAGSPMQLLQRDLLPMSRFFLELHDHPDELAQCAERIGTYFQRIFAVVADSAAEVILFGSNYDAVVTYPPFFAQHILPWLKDMAARLHAKGKFLLSHTDGENRGLLGHYLASEMDIADSICPAPMTKLTFKEVRDRFAGRITIMGGIPSTSLLRESMPERDFNAYLDTFFSELGAGDRLILGISDTTPPAADFARILEIGRRVQDFGPVGRAKS